MDEEYENTNTCVDENGNWPRTANEVVPQITNDQCENLKNNMGVDGTKRSNCDDLQAMICDIKQEVEWVASNSIMNIAANDASKCRDSFEPTLASMWSRILRYSQAVACILCAYDPFIANILKSGKYPQILMGSASANGYPTWVNPDELPDPDSKRPVTSAGVYKAVENAILSVWHLWKEQPEFKYFAQTLDSKDDIHNLLSQMEASPASEGDTALIASGDGKTSLLYKYTGGEWTFVRELTNATDNLTNFATTHIEKGAYATKGVYYFDSTWQVMDADLGELEDKVNILVKAYEHAVFSDDVFGYKLATRANYTEAMEVECDDSKETIVLITG